MIKPDYQMVMGDCHHLIQTVESESIDLIGIDPPYGQTNTVTKWNRPLSWDFLWPEMWRVLKPDGVIVINSIGMLSAELMVAMKSMFRHKYTWRRPTHGNFMLTRYEPLKFCEDVLVFSRGKPAIYNEQRIPIEPRLAAIPHGSVLFERPIRSPKVFPKHRWVTDRGPYDLLDFKFGSILDRRLMPTQKPVAMMEFLINTYSNEGDTVLDFCFGSGTSGVAAIRTGRRWIGFEQNERHFNLASDRLAFTE